MSVIKIEPGGRVHTSRDDKEGEVVLGGVYIPYLDDFRYDESTADLNAFLDKWHGPMEIGVRENGDFFIINDHNRHEARLIFDEDCNLVDR